MEPATAGLASMLIIGTVWFYILMAVWTFFLWWCVEDDRGFWATFSAIAVFALMGYAGNFNIVSYARDNPGHSVLAVGGYFLAGIIWSFGKWFFYTRKQRAKYNEAHELYLKNMRSTTLLNPEQERIRQQEIATKWRKIVVEDRYLSGYGAFEYMPKASNHKKRILTWASYWPWSMTWTLLNDPVKEAFNALFYRLQHKYQAISDRAFRGTEDDFNVK